MVKKNYSYYYIEEYKYQKSDLSYQLAIKFGGKNVFSTS